MEDVYLFFGIAVIFSVGSYFIIKSLLMQMKIRRAIRKNKLLLMRMREKDAAGRFYTYNDLISATLTNLRGKVKGVPYETLKELVDKEIDRLSGNRWERTASTLFVFMKMAFSIVFVSVSLLFALGIAGSFASNGEQEAAVLRDGMSEEKNAEQTESRSERKQREKEEKQQMAERKKLEKIEAVEEKERQKAERKKAEQEKIIENKHMKGHAADEIAYSKQRRRSEG